LANNTIKSIYFQPTGAVILLRFFLPID